MSAMFAPKAVTAPAAQAPAPMPDSDSPAAREARRRAQMDVLSRAGRSSTILTPPKSNNGDSYAAKKLGSDA